MPIVVIKNGTPKIIECLVRETAPIKIRYNDQLHEKERERCRKYRADPERRDRLRELARARYKKMKEEDPEKYQQYKELQKKYKAKTYARNRYKRKKGG